MAAFLLAKIKLAFTPVAHKIKLLPNNQQADHFRKACGVKRFAWNWALTEWERQFKARSPVIIDSFGTLQGYEKRTVTDDFGNSIPKANGQSLKKEFSAMIDQQWPWMRETTSYAYQRVFPELEQAYQRFFKGLAEKPLRKKKGRSKDTFYLANTCIEVTDRHVKIQKLGVVRMRQSLRFTGKIMSARVSRDGDHWWISIAVEIPDQQPTHSQADVAVGVDVGVKVMAALSTGEVRENPKALAHHSKRLKRLQRRLSRQLEAAKVNAGIAKGKAIPKGTKLDFSKRMDDVKIKIQNTHRRISGLRSNAQHQLSAELTKRFGVIAIEDLNVKGMTASSKGDAENPGKRVAQKSGLNRSILDVGFGEIRRQLQYKAERTGSKIVAIDRWFPSSKTCSSCGVVQKSMPLNVREWTCPACGSHHDRDINAAKNIKMVGVEMLKTPIVEKEKKRTGSLNPRRKQVSATAENTTGAVEIDGRGENGSESGSLDSTSLVETPTGQGIIPRQTPSSRHKPTHSLTAQARLQGDLFDGSSG